MARIAWTNELSVGIKIIDDQHMKLIEYINLLDDSILSGKSQNMLYKVLSGLEMYAWCHFETEGMLMKKFKFEETSAHKKEHNKFSDSVREFKDKLDSGDTKISEEVLLFLQDWLTIHIIKTDKKLGLALNKLGVM